MKVGYSLSDIKNMIDFCELAIPALQKGIDSAVDQGSSPIEWEMPSEGHPESIEEVMDRERKQDRLLECLLK